MCKTILTGRHQMEAFGETTKLVAWYLGRMTIPACTNMSVLLSPPRHGLRMCVSLQSRNGTCPGALAVPRVRGLHSSTFRLNVSAFCGIGGAFRGCLGGVEGVLGGIRGY